MIQSGNSARFTPAEIEEFRQIGLDLGAVRRLDDIKRHISWWAYTLADERFDLLEKIASEMAKARGMKMPSQVTAMPSRLRSPG